MRVKRLPIDPGVSGWQAILPVRKPRPALEDAREADFLVIGGGFAGLAAARRLREIADGAEITLLEARSIGEGPAGRNSGFMIDLPHDLSSDNYGGSDEKDRLQITMNRAAIDFAGTAAREYQMPEQAFAQSGKTNGAATARGETHNLNYSRHLTQLGEAHELLDAAQMKSLTGSDYYTSGLYSPGTAMIQPAMFVRHMADGLAASGVAIFENSPVIELSPGESGWRVKTPFGSVAAAKVILATNGHVESFGFFRRRLVHIYLYASMTRALTRNELKSLGGEQIWGITPSDPLGSTVRKIAGEGGERIVVRNRVTYAPGMRVDERRMIKMAKSHDRSFAARFPNLSAVSMEYRWGGQLCLSRNSMPAFGELKPGLYSACCQNGLGSTRGTLSGMLAAELATDNKSELLDAQLSLPTPSRIPPEPISSIGANLTLWWGERKAGAEL